MVCHQESRCAELQKVLDAYQAAVTAHKKHKRTPARVKKSPADAKTEKELASLRAQLLEATTENRVLHEQLDKALERAASAQSSAPSGSPSTFSDALALAAALKTDYSGIAEVLSAAGTKPAAALAPVQSPPQPQEQPQEQKYSLADLTGIMSVFLQARQF